MQSPEEALAVVKLGVDHIGVTPSDHNLPGEVNYETAREIFRAVGNTATRIAITVDTNIEVIVEMVKATEPDVLHICGRPVEAISPDDVSRLREMIPGVKIMIAIPVNTEKAVSLALEYEKAADFLILDTDVSHINGIGASGETHDWKISREIVEKTGVPVILAGGLSPENVKEAIAAVHPWCVDSLTHTNHSLGDGKFKKDLELIRKFVNNAKNREG